MYGCYNLFSLLCKIRGDLMNNLLLVIDLQEKFINENTKNVPNCTFVVSHLEDDTRKELEQMKKKNIIVPDDAQIIGVK